MEENNAVVTAPESEPATVFAFGPEDQVDADQGLAAPAGDGEQAPENEQGDTGDAGQFDGLENKDIGRAFAEERKRIEEKYRRRMDDDPTMRLGRLMVDDLMETSGLSREEAVKTATDNFLKAVAKREGISPGIARRLYGSEIKEAIDDEPAVDEAADQIIEDLERAPKPRGFDAEEAYNDPEFIQLLTEMPAAAAVRVWTAERGTQNARQDIAERLMARQSIPQMTRPSHVVTPKVDWTKVDSATFLAEKERRAKMGY